MAGFDLAAAVGGVSNSDTIGQLTLTYVDIDELHPDERNEKIYDLSDLEELEEAILQSHGLLQPIYAKPLEAGGWGIIAGHRRHAALRDLVDGTAKDTPPHPELRMVPVVYNRRENEEDQSLAEGAAEQPEKLRRAMEELRMIVANSANRVLSAPEVSRQAERMEELYVELSHLGVRFPGRLRDRVAHACKVSAAKLGRLKVIRDKLDPHFTAQFEAGKLTEQAAYAIARMPAEMQAALGKAMPKKPVPGGTAEKLLAIGMDHYFKRDNVTCPSGELCTHGLGLLSRDAHAQYAWDMGTCSCCATCYKSDKCAYACPAGKEAAQKKKSAQEKQAEKAKAVEQKLRDEETQLCVAFARRVTAAAQKAGADADQVVAQSGMKVNASYSTPILNKAAVWSGEGHFSRWSIFPRADVLAELCRTLEVSADYLLGLTDDAV